VNLEGHVVIEHSAGRDCWEEVVRLGAGVLVRRREGAHALDLVEYLLREGGLSRRPVAELAALLTQHGRPNVPPVQRQLVAPQLHSSADHEADCAILEAILRVTGGSDIAPAQPRSLDVLGAFVSGLRLGDYMIPAWRALPTRSQLEALDAVVAAAVDALGLDAVELARDAGDALGRIRTDPTMWLLSIVPPIFAEPDWRRAAQSPRDPQTLVMALLHPSLIVAKPAAILLSAGAGGQEAARFAMTVLERDEPAIIAPDFFAGGHVLGFARAEFDPGATLSNTFARVRVTGASAARSPRCAVGSADI
jgi:hypothetical protein